MSIQQLNSKHDSATAGVTATVQTSDDIAAQAHRFSSGSRSPSHLKSIIYSNAMYMKRIRSS